MSRRIVRQLMEYVADLECELSHVTAERDKLIQHVFREEDADGCSC